MNLCILSFFVDYKNESSIEHFIKKKVMSFKFQQSITKNIYMYFGNLTHSLCHINNDQRHSTVGGTLKN